MRTTLIALFALVLAACSAPPASVEPGSLIPDERARVEAFFGAPYPHGFETIVVPDRAAFADLTERRWGFRAEPCWMVAAGTGSVLAMIDPASWRTEACEHDPDDPEHVRRIVAHELVHVYHGQHNADPEFDTMEGLAWFAEGLAVYASGQFDEERRVQAARAAEDAWPDRLDDAWSGQARYAVCGAMVAWIDETRGRALIIDLLAAGTTPEALELLELDEPSLLASVRAWLRAPPPGS